ncbi:hypothetical protein PAESOLCIP111_02429 [Paenibacillus solanacearum]|uniref:Xylose isomerase-like TIM barrel domain-containing protein n=1 Tax=Paenibacillus solanacearum TaxID=2048548 RepID=A0A916K0M1_9BACL|nr:sugar phosphate isomerase/epimerase [Paenibacillus solanacearum]CAG7622465.1 hypothetical protein PAESOLCIP111_02429 [Paenibacillus solanacearum]
MKVSTSLNVFLPDNPIDRAMERCRDAGFTTLDFNYWDYQKYVHGLTWEEEEAWAQRIRALADSLRLRFTQMHGPVHGRSFSDMVLQLNEESFLAMAARSLQTAAILGIPWVVFHPSAITGSGEPYKELLAYNVRFYERLLPAAERTGVGLALENMYDRTQAQPLTRRRAYCAMPDELIELIDTLNHPLVGACWDTGHAHEQSLDQARIRELGSRLKATHINDNDGIRDLHLLPFSGTIQWNAVMEALRDIRYAGDFTYEAHSSIRVLPDGLRDAGLRYAAELGNYLVRSAGGEEA